MVQSTWNFHQVLGSINNVDLQKFNLITWLVCILQTQLWNEIFRSVKYTLVTWSIWYFANQYYLLILAPGENFKSIGPLDHSKWYPSNEEFDFTDRSVKYQPDRWPNWNFAHRLILSIPITGKNFKSKAPLVLEIQNYSICILQTGL